ncbi:hypothetical protein [Dyadobacter sp. CY356]|uniref:hypothetical protein n=1 Tax=Dyadobacter sp. CY356 TaxID=2906442 RepID=UPI001F482876|nr:hypothetical protein [Dyadobacter sp. CY356]MCF0058990.1 hypothetical protein [Dyadobacter sp. CY356]
MKVVEKNITKASERGMIYNPSLDDLPVPQIALEKAEKAKETLRKYPIPSHFKRN